MTLQTSFDLVIDPPKLGVAALLARPELWKHLREPSGDGTPH
jgi:hypothetical protein